MTAGRLDGAVAIVTGAAHGIGQAIAVELGRAGAVVWACDVLEAELEGTRRAVAGATGGRCEAVVVDVADAGQVAAFVARVAAAEGRVGVLVNTAGDQQAAKEPGDDGV